MKISPNSIKVGNILSYENDLWIVTKHPEHIKPGKGPAYVQLEMKNVKKKTKIYKRFNTNDTLIRAQLAEREAQYLYSESSDIIFMYTDTFEQINISKKSLENKIAFFTDGIKVTILLYNKDPIDIILPSTITLEIMDTEPVIKGAALNPGYKTAILSNGLLVSVPYYLTVGEKIIIKTEDLSFVSKAK